MLQQRQQRDRRKTLDRNARDRKDKRPCRHHAQRSPTRIVGIHAPPFQMRHHPLGQRTVRRDQGGCASGCFQRLAQSDRNALRFVRRSREFGKMDTGQLTKARRQRIPLGGELCGGKSVRNGAGALRMATLTIAPSPSHHVASGNLHSVQKKTQVVLRMRFGRRLSDRVPLLTGAVNIDAGQNDLPVRQSSNSAQQLCHSLCRCRNARCDNKPDRGCGSPYLRLSPQQDVAPFDQIDPPQPRQFLGPSVEQDRNHVERLLPMDRQVVCNVERL